MFILLAIAQVFHGPAKASSTILVDGFQQEKSAADFKYRCADKSSDAAAVKNLSLEFLLRHEGQEDEEAVQHPDNTSQGEDESNEPGYVPYGKASEHPPDPTQDVPKAGRWWGCDHRLFPFLS